MPRIPHSILLQAYSISPLLPLVLRGSRTLPSALNELRWLKEHIQEISSIKNPKLEKRRLLQLCKRRARGEPLQYILGSQPFGDLDIKCRPGVLIPRPETEAYTTYLAHLITSNRLDDVLTHNFLPGSEVLSISNNTKTQHLKILDLCTGSGCIPILLNSLVSKSRKEVEIYAWDISKTAVSLARENWIRNVRLGNVKNSSHSRVQFEVADIFDHADVLQNVLCNQSNGEMINPEIDIIISNPPYISQAAFRTETTRSVQNWEPRLALIPRKLPNKMMPQGVDAADIFYHRLLYLHSDIFRSKVLLMEVGDEAQALRVAKMAMDHYGTSNYIELWKDNPEGDCLERIQSGSLNIPVRGHGAYRAVALFRFGRLSTLLQSFQGKLSTHSGEEVRPSSSSGL